MRNYGQFCGLARALDHVGQRWTLLIVRELLLGPKRFTDLLEGLPGVATNLLTDRLRQLQEDGLVRQRELPAPASSTVYELTSAGAALRPAVEELIRWGGRWMETGPGEDLFRADWLALALEALGAGRRLEADAVIRIETPAGSTMLSMSPRGVVVQPDGEPDLTVRGDPSVLLGVASGRIPFPMVAEALEVEAPGEDGLGLLARALAPG